MHKRDRIGQIITERTNRLCEISCRRSIEVVPLRIGTDDNGETDIGHEVEQLWMPARSEAFSRRQIATDSFAGIEEVHPDQSEQRRIPELLLGDAEPIQKPPAARVIPWDPAPLRFDARGLADDGYPGTRADRVDRRISTLARPSVIAVIDDRLADRFETHWVSVAFPCNHGSRRADRSMHDRPV